MEALASPHEVLSKKQWHADAAAQGVGHATTVTELSQHSAHRAREAECQEPEHGG